MVSGVHGGVICIAQTADICHVMTMTNLLQNAFDRAKTLPAHRQDEVGEMVLHMVDQEQSSLQLSEFQQNEVRARLSKPLNLIPDAEMKEFFRKLVG